MAPANSDTRSALAPLPAWGDGRASRRGVVTHEVTWDGRSGYGLSEYLDQIVDGEPVGVAG